MYYFHLGFFIGCCLTGIRWLAFCLANAIRSRPSSSSMNSGLWSGIDAMNVGSLTMNSAIQQKSLAVIISKPRIDNGHVRVARGLLFCVP